MTEYPRPTAVVALLYDLFGQNRIDETFDLMHSDVVLHEPGDPSLLPWAGTHRGHEGLGRFYAGLTEGLSEIVIDPHSLHLREIGENQVLALGTERGVSAATGRSYETKSAWIWTVLDGQVTELYAFHDTAAMCRACEA